MGRIRKTANIARILARTNHRLLHSTCSPEARRGMATVLESILMDAGLYSGFGYIGRSALRDVGLNNEPQGVEYRDDKGSEITAELYFGELTSARTDGRKPRFVQSFPDESRRFYYVHRAIHKDTDRLMEDGEKS